MIRYDWAPQRRFVRQRREDLFYPDKAAQGVSTFFNGSSYVSCGDSAQFVENLTKCTWHMWFYPTAWTNNQAILSKNSSGARKFDIRTSTGDKLTVSLRAGDAGTTSCLLTTETSAVATDEWNHLVVSYDGEGATNDDKLKLYISGTWVSASFGATDVSSTLGPTETNPIEIGATAGGLLNLSDCYIADVAIFTGSSASDAQARELFNSGSLLDLDGSTLGPPTHWWKMGDDATYPTIPDVGSAASNHGVMNGFNPATAFSSFDVPDVWGNTYSGHWPGDAYFNCGYSTGPFSSGSTEWTVSLWFRANGGDLANRTMFGWKGTQTGNVTYARISGSLIIGAIKRSDAASFSTFISEQDAWTSGSDWNHLVMTFDGSDADTKARLKFYVDGVRVQTSSVNYNQISEMPVDIGQTVIGSHYFGTAHNFTDGNIDEICIWDTCAIENDIASMTGSAGRPGDPSLCNLGDPVHYWSFDSFDGTTMIDAYGDNDATLAHGAVSRSIDIP